MTAFARSRPTVAILVHELSPVMDADRYTLQSWQRPATPFYSAGPFEGNRVGPIGGNRACKRLVPASPSPMATSRHNLLRAVRVGLRIATLLPPEISPCGVTLKRARSPAPVRVLTVMVRGKAMGCLRRQFANQLWFWPALSGGPV